MKQTCGKNHASTLKTMMNLVILYKTAGDLNDVFDDIELFILLGNGAITVLYES